MRKLLFKVGDYIETPNGTLGVVIPRALGELVPLQMLSQPTETRFVYPHFCKKLDMRKSKNRARVAKALIGT